jgi:hypothetical protein
MPRLTKNPLSKKCTNIKTEFNERDSKYFSFREKLSSKKKESK